MFVCFWDIVLLHDPTALQLPFTEKWPNILPENFLIQRRIYSSVNEKEDIQVLMEWNISNPHTTTLVLDFKYEV